jgi:hypothetical protein
MRIRLRNRCVLLIRDKSESRQHKDMGRQSLDQLQEWIIEKHIPYISNDKFIPDATFHCWAGRLSGHAHVNQSYPESLNLLRLDEANP